MKEALARDEYQTGGKEADCIPKMVLSAGRSDKGMARTVCLCRGRYVFGRRSRIRGPVRDPPRWVDDCSEGARWWGACFFGVKCCGSENVGLLEWQQPLRRWSCAQAVVRKASRVVLRNLRVEQVDRRSGTLGAFLLDRANGCLCQQQ